MTKRIRMDNNNPHCIRFITGFADVTVSPSSCTFSPEGKFSPADVNWQCCGAVTPEKALIMAEALTQAAQYAKADIEAFQHDHPDLKPVVR